MKISTERYEWVNGRKPKGRGTWIFQVTGSDENGAFLTETVRAYGTFAEARKQAEREFRSSYGRVKKVWEMIVLP